MGAHLIITAHLVPDIDYPDGPYDEDANRAAVVDAYRRHIDALPGRYKLTTAMWVEAGFTGASPLFDDMRQTPDEFDDEEIDALARDPKVTAAVEEFWTKAIDYVSGYSRHRSEIDVAGHRVALYGGPSWGDLPMDEFPYADAMSLVPSLSLERTAPAES
ncbi:hypothetical protein [Dietzia sp. 179-F 9C3 NHS]|uniref:hypothetical protein n=1 Tax=Dietzia sp. 179-F 9C3 NHS TaxID=3374295 RepID=UPI0038799E51